MGDGEGRGEKEGKWKKSERRGDEEIMKSEGEAKWRMVKGKGRKKGKERK